MAPPREPTPGFSDSDQQWFDRLSGKPVVVTDPEALREADALRLALEMEHEAAESGAPQDAAELQRQWEQLQFRARREGLLDRPASPWRERRTILVGLAAAVVLSAVLVPVWQGSGDDYDAPPVMRGEHVLRELRVADPKGAAEGFATALRDAGLKPGLYRRDKTYVVDVDLKPDQLGAAAPAFARLALQPAAGTTRVELTRP